MCQVRERVPCAGSPAAKPKMAKVAAAPKSAAPSPPDDSVPQHIRVYCRVCQTHDVRPARRDRPQNQMSRLRCPERRAATGTAEDQAKPQPVDDSDDLELWGVDKAPSVAEMVAAQPKFISVECPTCQTLMQVPEKQVGQEDQMPRLLQGESSSRNPLRSEARPLGPLAR